MKPGVRSKTNGKLRDELLNGEIFYRATNADILDFW